MTHAPASGHRWQGRERFTVLELGFDAGQHFIATWQAWRDDARRPTRLVFVAIEPQPVQPAGLAGADAASPPGALARQLFDAWPALTRGLHPLFFEAGRVELLLAIGDAVDLLPGLRLQADAIRLHGQPAPAATAAAWEPRLLKALGGRAAPGASLAADAASQPLSNGLRAAGFDVHPPAGGDGTAVTTATTATTATFAPRYVVRAALATPRTAVVIGAGLAGAAVATALARRGVAVTVLERLPTAAAGASANPAALFHATVHADDSVYARLFRAAALFAARAFSAAGLPPSGVLRLASAEAAALPAAAGLPVGFVRGVDAAQASTLAGVALPSPAWHFAGGGWAEPAQWVRQALAAPGIELRTGIAVARIGRTPNGDGSNIWSAFDTTGVLVAQADLLVLANAEACAPLLRTHASAQHPAWPLQRRRGQVSWWTPAMHHSLRLPVAGDGYAIPLPGGALLCGATRQEGDDDASVRHADHAENLRRLRQLTGIGPSTGAVLSGWVGWRLHSDDRLPIAGALPLASMPNGQRLDQARLLPREAGLFVLTALGARGLTLAPLLGELIAAQATGDAWPLEQALADAVDPGRWLVRAARAGSAR